MYQKSDIVVIPYPFTDLSSNKLRPVLMLTSANAQGDFLAMQITSKAGHDNAETLENADLEIGQLPKQSFVRPDKLVTLHTSLINKRIGQLTQAATKKFDQIICNQLGC
ncbi:type II toxin-antitoxin system PemK/MazF family toxin [Thiomicrospira sp. R3]|uniref:type II toxin-antitoxin system PemK/MazF family toxin n=1 Tax=Thiomicrospira sp. R3 TaxID=3035472 RepID=UPI00259BB014|nr:type II toxin-antitoxin system PemK/MazF family toxin [Thiomicrospira sp. R3]WFE69182.1 type II toxin-antitoxin system PemK/MazF family toxin [Thiomicrospira sp. R3]